MPCICLPGVRSSDCPDCRPVLLTSEEVSFVLMVEDAWIAAGKRIPPRSELRQLFALAKKVVTEKVG